jgi:hypothetical protein
MIGSSVRRRDEMAIRKLAVVRALVEAGAVLRVTRWYARSSNNVEVRVDGDRAKFAHLLGGEVVFGAKVAMSVFERLRAEENFLHAMPHSQYRQGAYGTLATAAAAREAQETEKKAERALDATTALGRLQEAVAALEAHLATGEEVSEKLWCAAADAGNSAGSLVSCLLRQDAA